MKLESLALRVRVLPRISDARRGDVPRPRDDVLLESHPVDHTASESEVKLKSFARMLGIT